MSLSTEALESEPLSPDLYDYDFENDPIATLNRTSGSFMAIHL